MFFFLKIHIWLCSVSFALSAFFVVGERAFRERVKLYPNESIMYLNIILISDKMHDV